MKYLKKYKLFESLEQDVEDIFLELKDDGYDVEVDIRPQGLETVSIDVSRDDLFNWSDVKDYFERCLDAIGDTWKLGKIVLNYATAIKLAQFVYDKTNESFVECEGKELQIGLPTGMFGMILKMVLKTIGLEIKFTDKVSDKAS